MAKTVTKEVREKIVRAYEHGVGTIEEVAIIFDLSPRTIAKFLKLYREGKDLTPGRHTGRPAILTKENLAVVKTVVSLNKDGTLQEYADEFKTKTGIEVTYVTMHNACKKLNLRRKKRVFMRKNRKDEM